MGGTCYIPLYAAPPPRPRFTWRWGWTSRNSTAASVLRAASIRMHLTREGQCTSRRVLQAVGQG